jgi:hypothetical protein
MTNEQMEGEVEQHTEWLKIHDEAISEFREKIKALSKFAEELMKVDFTTPNNQLADQSKKLMRELVKQILAT